MVAFAQNPHKSRLEPESATNGTGLDAAPHFQFPDGSCGEFVFLWTRDGYRAVHALSLAGPSLAEQVGAAMCSTECGTPTDAGPEGGGAAVFALVAAAAVVVALSVLLGFWLGLLVGG